MLKPHISFRRHNYGWVGVRVHRKMREIEVFLGSKYGFMLYLDPHPYPWQKKEGKS